MDLHRLAAIWNAVGGTRKWTGASLAEEFILIGLRESWKGVGGRPEVAPRVVVKRKSVRVDLSPETVAKAEKHVREERASSSKGPHCPHCGKDLPPGA